jgi:hypothetical protein
MPAGRGRRIVSAPASVHQAARRRAALIVEREYQPDPARCVAAIVKLLTYQAPVHRAAIADTAAPSRPLRAGVQPTTMHNDRVSPPRDNPAVAEDDRRDALTSTDA